MNQKLCEGGVSIASTNKMVPGLNNHIIEGGLGFNFSIENSFDVAILQDKPEKW